MYSKDAFLELANLTNQSEIFKHFDTSRESVKYKLFAIIVPILAICIICLNLLVVISSGLILRAHFEPRTTYLFMGNVASADFFMGITILIRNYFPKDQMTQTLCELILGFLISTNLISAWSVALIAMDRFLYIVYGIKYKLWMYPSRARILIVVAWIFGLFIGSLPLMGLANPIDVYGPAGCFYMFLMPPVLELFILMAGLFPILLVICIYSIILWKALKKIKQIRLSGKLTNQTIKSDGKLRVYYVSKEQTISAMSPNKWKAIKVVLCTGGAITVTWLPYIICCAIYCFCSKSLSCQVFRFTIGHSLSTLLFINSLLNPFIYAWWHNGFRIFLFKTFSKISKNNSNKRSTNKSSIYIITRL